MACIQAFIYIKEKFYPNILFKKKFTRFPHMNLKEIITPINMVKYLKLWFFDCCTVLKYDEYEVNWWGGKKVSKKFHTDKRDNNHDDIFMHHA